MKIFFFKRDQMSKFLAHADSYIEGVYVPEENVILVREKQGPFGCYTYAVLDKPLLLPEIKRELSGETQNTEGVIYSKIREFEGDTATIRKIIQLSRVENELKAKVDSGIEGLLNQGSRS